MNIGSRSSKIKPRLRALLGASSTTSKAKAKHVTQMGALFKETVGREGYTEGQLKEKVYSCEV